MSNARARRPDLKRARNGFLQIAIIGVAAAAIFFLDEILRATQEGPEIVVLTPAASGIGPGSTVWVAGRPVGRVHSVEFIPPGRAGPEKLVIRAVLRRSATAAIRADAVVTLLPAGLLEPVVVSIRPGTPSAPPLDVGDTLRTTATIDQDSVLALGRRLRAAGAALAERAAEARQTLTGGRGTLARLSADTAVSARLRRDLRALRTLLERDLPNGTLGRVVRDTALAGSLRRLASRFPAPTSPAPDPAVRPADALAALEGVSGRLTRLSAGLEAGNGTAGRALRDGELGRQSLLLRARLDSLVAELVADPRRWLRFRIF